MMRKTLKTTIATIASMALIGATTVLSAGAVSIDIQDVTLPEVPTNKVVPVEVYVKDSTGFNLMSLVVNHDVKLVPGRISTRSFNADIPLDAAAGTPEASTGKLALSAAGAEIFNEANFTLMTINFTIPEDAKPGDRYPITFQDFSSLAKFSFGSSTTPIAAGALVASGGFIEIAPEVTTVTTTTTTEPTTTTTVTTTEPTDTVSVTTPQSGVTGTDVTTAVTTAGSTTTSRATTTTARTTTTTKSSATNSPKTGDATKGVIPAMAAMAAAAVAAFVVRKKK